MSDDVVIVVFTDGRDDTLAATMASARENLPDMPIVIHDDTGLEDHFTMLRDTYPGVSLIGGHRSGFDGAIARAWQTIPALSDTIPSYLFHLEDDFTFNEPVDIDGMRWILDTHLHVAQVALLRQGWSQPEIDNGGVIGLAPELYTDHHVDGLTWCEHRIFFTTNPSLYRWSLTHRGWPQQAQSEAEFARRLFENPSTTCAYYGSKTDGPRVHHIGEQRVGWGY